MGKTIFKSFPFEASLTKDRPAGILPLPYLTRAENCIKTRTGALQSRPPLQKFTNLPPSTDPDYIGKALSLFTIREQLFAVGSQGFASYRASEDSWTRFERRANIGMSTLPIQQKETDSLYPAMAKQGKSLYIFYVFEGKVFYRTYDLIENRVYGGERDSVADNSIIRGRSGRAKALYAEAELRANGNTRRIWVGALTENGIYIDSLDKSVSAFSHRESDIKRFVLEKDRVFYVDKNDAVKSVIYNPSAEDTAQSDAVTEIQDPVATAQDFRGFPLHDFQTWTSFIYKGSHFRVVWSVQTGFFLLDFSSRLVAHFYSNFTPFEKASPPKMVYLGKPYIEGTKVYFPVCRAGQQEEIAAGQTIFPLGIELVVFDMERETAPKVVTIGRQSVISGPILSYSDGQTVNEWTWPEKPKIVKTATDDYDKWPYSDIDIELPAINELERDQVAEVTLPFEGRVAPYLVKGVTFKAQANGSQWQSAPTADRTLRYSSKVSDGSISSSYGGVLSKVFYDDSARAIVAEFTSAPATLATGRDHPQTIFIAGARYDFQYWNVSSGTLKAYHYTEHNPITVGSDYEIKIPHASVIVSTGNPQTVQVANQDNRNTELRINEARLRRYTEKRIGRVQGVEEDLNTARVSMATLKTDDTRGAVSSGLASVLGITAQMITTYRGRDLPLFGSSTYAETTGPSGSEYVPPDAVIDPREGSYKFRYFGRSNVWTFESTDVSVPTPSYIYVNGVRIARTASNRGSSPHSFTFGNVPSGSKGNAGTFNLNVEFSGGRLLFNTPTTRINTSLGTLASTRITGTSADLAGIEYTASDKLYIYFSGAKTAYSNSGALDSVIRTLLKSYTFTEGDDEYIYTLPGSLRVANNYSDTNNVYVRYEITPVTELLETIIGKTNINLLFTRKATTSFEEIDTQIEPSVYSAIYSAFDNNDEAKEVTVQQVNPVSIFFLTTDRNQRNEFFFADRTFEKIPGPVGTNNYYYFATEDNPLRVNADVFSFAEPQTSLNLSYPLIRVQPNVSTDQILSARVYRYKCCFKHIDNNGIEHRSPFSDTISLFSNADIGLEGNRPTFDVNYLNLTNRKSGTIGIEIYRTANRSQVFRLVKEVQNRQRNEKALITDDVEDTDLGQVAVADTLFLGGAREVDGYRDRFVFSNFYEKPNRLVISSPQRPLTNQGIDLKNQGTVGDAIEILLSSEVKAARSMDSLLVIFGIDKSWVWTINERSLAQNSPEEITTLLNSSIRDGNSVLPVELGLIIQTDKGFWSLSRGLDLKDIGADIQGGNDGFRSSSRVRSCLTLQDKEEARFITDDPNFKICIFNMRFGTWTTFNDMNLISSAIYGIGEQKAWCALDEAGNVLREVPQDQPAEMVTSVPKTIKIVVSTGFVNLASILDFNRIREVTLLADFQGLEELELGVSYDFNPAVKETIEYRVTPRQSGVLDLAAYEQREFRFQFRQQICSSIRFIWTARAVSAEFQGFRIGYDVSRRSATTQHARVLTGG